MQALEMEQISNWSPYFWQRMNAASKTQKNIVYELFCLTLKKKKKLLARMGYGKQGGNNLIFKESPSLKTFRR